MNSLKLCFALFSLVLVLFVGNASAAFTFNKSVNGSSLEWSSSETYFVEPSSVSYEDGMLYVSDSFKSYVYGIANNTVKKTIGGRSGTFDTLNRPHGIFVENGEVFIADTNSGRGKIYKGTPSLVGVGADIGREANMPEGIAAYGTVIYLLNTGDSKIRFYDRKTLVYQKEIGEEGVGDGQFEKPTDIFIYAGRIYIADKGNNRIEVLSMNFTYLDSIGRGKGGVILSRPEGVFVGDNRVYVADTGNARVAVFTLAGDPVETLGKYGSGDYEFDNPRDVFVAEGKLYVADTYNRKVKIYNINDTADQALTSSLAQVAEKVRVLEELAAAGAKIDVRTGSDARMYLNNAQDDMAAQSYIAAREDIAKANSSANSGIAALQSALDYRLRSMVTVSRERLGELPANVSSDDRVRIGAMISGVDQNLKDKQYVAAVDGILGAESELSMLSGSPVEPVSPPSAADGQKAAFDARVKRVGEQLKAIEGLANNYNMTIDRAEIDSLVANAAARYDWDASGAGAALGSAESKVNTLIQQLEAKFSNIDKASAAINDADKQIKNVEGSWSGSLVKPNLVAAKGSLSQARAKLYSDPEASLALANQAKDSALTENSNAARTQSWLIQGGAAAILTIAGAVVIAAIVIAFVFGRRRRGL